MAAPNRDAGGIAPGANGAATISPSPSGLPRSLSSDQTFLRVFDAGEIGGLNASGVTVAPLVKDWDFGFVGYPRDGGARASQALGSPAYYAAVRRREAENIRHRLEGLHSHAADPNIAVYTYPIVRALNNLVSQLTEARSEGNSREFLRRVRNSIMDGGWEEYRRLEARQCVADALGFLTEVETVLPADIKRLTHEMEQSGLHPYGMPLFEYDTGTPTNDGEEEAEEIPD